MQDNSNQETERRETTDELYNLIIMVQQVGRRLANETHGDAYTRVRELNEILHEARLKANEIVDALEDTPR